MKKIFFAIPVLLFILQKSFGQYWHVKELSPLPEPVTNNAVAGGFIDGSPFVFTFGGLDSTRLYSGIHRRCYRYHVNRDLWEPIPSLPDTLGKVASSASRIGNIIYILGGYYVFKDGHELSSNKVHRYDVIKNRFLSDGAPIPLPIDDHVQTVWRDSLIYLITGWSHKENKSNVQIYNPSSDSWTTGTPVPDSHQYKSFGASGVIINNTIYYFGGAAYGKFYPAQNQLRIGKINPKAPGEISWSVVIPDENIYGYRTAATKVEDKAFWLGGSQVTYNYNGIAYNGSGGVMPSHQILRFDGNTKTWAIQSGIKIPMDLRNLAEIEPTTKYIVGGMESGQKVSNKTLRISYEAN